MIISILNPGRVQIVQCSSSTIIDTLRTSAGRSVRFPNISCFRVVTAENCIDWFLFVLV